MKEETELEDKTPQFEGISEENTTEQQNDSSSESTTEEKDTDWKEEEDIPISWRTILGGDILAGKWFRRHFFYIVMLTIMCIIYISNRYSCQQQILRTTKLEDTLRDRRIKALTISSELKEMLRPSSIEKSVEDTALKRPIESIYKLEVQ